MVGCKRVSLSSESGDRADDRRAARSKRRRVSGHRNSPGVGAERYCDSGFGSESATSLHRSRARGRHEVRIDRCVQRLVRDKSISPPSSPVRRSRRRELRPLESEASSCRSATRHKRRHESAETSRHRTPATPGKRRRKQKNTRHDKSVDGLAEQFENVHLKHLSPSVRKDTKRQNEDDRKRRSKDADRHSGKGKENGERRRKRRSHTNYSGRFRRGDILHDRYEVLETLGEGAFGKVLKAKDLENSGETVAVKTIKKIRSRLKHHRDAARQEIKVLEKIREKDPEGESHCLHMMDWFNHHGNNCMTFKVLGQSVFDFMLDNDFQPFPIHQVKRITYQLLQAVAFLHKNKLTHTDLKQENILFVDSSSDETYCREERRLVRRVRNTDIQLIDFGLAAFDNDHHSLIVSTRQYRAPEIMLGLGWSHPCDIWSVGCIAFEIYFGEMLFEAQYDHEHLAMMERILGKIPKKMVRNTRKRAFFTNDCVRWDWCGEEGREVVEKCQPLKRSMLSRGTEHEELFDLLKRLLEYDPKHRLTAKEALKHSFFHELR